MQTFFEKQQLTDLDFKRSNEICLKTKNLNGPVSLSNIDGNQMNETDLNKKD